MSWTLAIDFGTSNTVAAVRLPGGEVRSVRLSSDADQMPSCVFVEDQGIVVGQPAAMRAMSAPTRFEANPKRRIGDDVVRLGQRTVGVVELVAAVLRQAAGRAAATMGGTPPAQVVLTHPEAWARSRITQLTRAADLAGIGPVLLLPEPAAAAMWYLRATRLPAEGRVAVFDFGGGTCDVAVLRADPAAPTGFVVLASAGEDQLGGEHIDRRLLDWVDTQLRASGRAELADRLEHPDEIASWLTLRDQVRAAKHALSEYPSAHIAVRTMHGTASLLITVEEFDRLIGQDVDRAVALVERVLEEAGGPPPTACYLTGGTSLIPVVQRRVADALGFPPATLDDPKLVVALGAATGAPATPIMTTQVLPVIGRASVPRPGRSKRTALIAAAGAAVVLLGGVGVYLLLPRSEPPPVPPIAASTPDTPAPTSSAETETFATSSPTTVTPDMAATFPDLRPLTEGTDPTGLTCSVRDRSNFPTASNGEQPLFVLDCEYTAQPQGNVAFMQWADAGAAPRFITELRTSVQPIEEFVTWGPENEPPRGPYLATRNEDDPTNPFYLWGAYENKPYSFAISGPTLELANTLYNQVDKGPA